MDFKHTIIKPHPLDASRWMVFIPEIPFVPPYFGSKQECEKTRVSMEMHADMYLKNNK